MIRFYSLIATFFYIGRLTTFPGTVASLVSLILYYFIFLNFNNQLELALVALISFVGLFSSAEYAKLGNDHDPSDCVIDEVAGMGVAILFLPSSFLCYMVAFLLFRVLDIFKPSFIHHVQFFKKGWGIMLDDILAGLISLLIVHGLLGKGIIY